MATALMVLARILSNPVSNLFQKRLTQRSANPVFIIAATHALLTLVCIPALIRTPVLALPVAFWANMMLCAVLAVTSNVLLVFALRSMDLSVLGPINAYKSVVSMILAVFLIGEKPTPLGLAGVLLIVAGSYFIVDRAPGVAAGSAVLRFAGQRGIQLRLAALVFSATEAVFLKKALLLADPLTTFLVWAALGFAVGALAMVAAGGARLREHAASLQADFRTYVWLTLTTGVMQLTTLYAFGVLQVGYSLALFQLSALVSVFLGHRYFQESGIARRLLGSAIMVTGAAMIVTAGLQR